MKYMYQVMRHTYDYGTECLATFPDLKEAEKMLVYLNENSEKLPLKFWIDILDVFNDFEDVRVVLGEQALYNCKYGL